ncbi:MAG: hypothetical protein GC181_16135 [Bacteroidetes bacterium]|nr:hypothetical protein [Bacteroidota bacterium]
MRKITFLSIACFLAAFQWTSAQVSTEKRLEFELKDDYVGESIYTFGEEGLIMRSVSQRSDGGNREWKFDLYDTDLELDKTKSVEMPKSYYSDETTFSDERLHTFFRDKRGNCKLVTAEAKNLNIIEVEGKMNRKLYTSQLAVLGDFCYLKATKKSGGAFLISMNWKNGEMKTIPVTISGVNAKKIQLKNFQVLKESNEIFLYAQVAVSKKKTESYIIRLNDAGEIVSTFKLSRKGDYNYLAITAYKLDQDKYIFTGTYSSKFTALSSDGMFICKTEGDEISQLEVYRFIDLDNFLDFMPKKSRSKIEKKKKKMADKNRDFAISYQLAVHNIIPVEDGFIFLGEAFYPTYRTETYTTTSFVNGHATTTTQTRTVFDGYQYTHALVAKFNDECELAWDVCFKMYSITKPFYVKKFISVSGMEEDELKLVFADFDRIISMTVDMEGDISQDKESKVMDKEKVGDKTLYSSTFIRHWYDNHYLVYGTQLIKNKEDKSVKKKRSVFFMTKLAYE